MVHIYEDPDPIGAIAHLDFKDLAPSTDIGPRPEFAWIDVTWLQIDERYQRHIGSEKSRRLIRRIVENFSWQRFQPLIVVQLDSGRFAVIDGQHRGAAAILHPLVTEVPAWILTAPELKRQAETFIAVNSDRVGMTQLHLYRAQLAAGENDALEIEELCQTAGITIVNATRLSPELMPRSTVAVSTIRKLLSTFGKPYLLAALEMLGDVSEHTGDQIRGELITCATRVIATFGEKLDHARLSRVLEEFDFPDLIDAARQVRRMLGGRTTIDGMVQAILAKYNANLHADRRLDANASPPTKKRERAPSMALSGVEPIQIVDTPAPPPEDEKEPNPPKTIRRRCSSCSVIFESRSFEETQCNICVAAGRPEPEPEEYSRIVSSLAGAN
jgi:hypothetical protein